MSISPFMGQVLFKIMFWVTSSLDSGKYGALKSASQYPSKVPHPHIVFLCILRRAGAGPANNPDTP